VARRHFWSCTIVLATLGAFAIVALEVNRGALAQAASPSWPLLAAAFVVMAGLYVVEIGFLFIMPLAVLRVLPSMFPEQFQPGGPEAGDWIAQFGFIPGRPGVNEGLPVGFFVSTRRPRSGGPSPTRFAGVNCSLCHTARLTRNGCSRVRYAARRTNRRGRSENR
jgi:hypothetical protein